MKKKRFQYLVVYIDFANGNFLSNKDVVPKTVGPLEMDEEHLNFGCKGSVSLTHLGLISRPVYSHLQSLFT